MHNTIRWLDFVAMEWDEIKDKISVPIYIVVTLAMFLVDKYIDL